ncbi:MAG: hypothetical protein J7J73_02715 [Deltaproteobacteria bacterium]|nr:hypothetical protein [Deltaproteobacteria bacterium]
MHNALGISIGVKLVEPNTAKCSKVKAKRVIDRRRV